MSEFTTPPSDVNSAASSEWMRYTLANLNQSVDKLAHELRETKNALEVFVREEKRELTSRLENQEQRLNELEMSVAVLKDRMLRIAVIGTFVVGAIVTIIVPAVFRIAEEDAKSFIPSRASIDRSIAATSDRSTSDPASSENK